MIAGSLSDALNCSADVSLWPIPDMAPAWPPRPLLSEERTWPRFMSSRPSKLTIRFLSLRLRHQGRPPRHIAMARDFLCHQG